MPDYKVVHSTVDKAELRASEKVVDEFGKAVKKQIKLLMADGTIPAGWKNAPTQEILLKLRTELTNSVKKGMLERKDLEERIAALAVTIWFARQEEARRHEVLSAWG